jgi:GAF domain-containing protein
VVATEAHSSGAIVAPLVTSDGCSGTLSVELKEGVRITPQLKAVATILAAQLATLITPSAQGGTQEPPAARL